EGHRLVPLGQGSRRIGASVGGWGRFRDRDRRGANRLLREPGGCRGEGGRADRLVARLLVAQGAPPLRSTAAASASPGRRLRSTSGMLPYTALRLPELPAPGCVISRRKGRSPSPRRRSHCIV